MPPVLWGMLQGAVAGEARLQVCFFSATLHSPEIKALSEKLCQHPTWVDLKVCPWHSVALA